MKAFFLPLCKTKHDQTKDRGLDLRLNFKMCFSCNFSAKIFTAGYFQLIQEFFSSSPTYG